MVVDTKKEQSPVSRESKLASVALCGAILISIFSPSNAVASDVSACQNTEECQLVVHQRNTFGEVFVSEIKSSTNDLQQFKVDIYQQAKSSPEDVDVVQLQKVKPSKIKFFKDSAGEQEIKTLDQLKLLKSFYIGS